MSDDGAGDPPAGGSRGRRGPPDADDDPPDRVGRRSDERRDRSRRGDGGPPTRANGGESERPSGVREWVRWVRTVESGPVMLAREILSSILLVALVGALLFGVSGVWPPMVAVQSGSMEPHMFRGDLVFIVDEHRFAPGGAAVEGTGVVPYVAGEERGYTKFGSYGDVIVYEPNGRADTDPIIHRAQFWVEEGENWYPRADPDHVRADSCAELKYCPAPNSGFITRGDNPASNRYYDQAQGMSRPVDPAWVKGKAEVRVPGLGWIRLKFAELGQTMDVSALVVLEVAGSAGR